MLSSMSINAGGIDKRCSSSVAGDGTGGMLVDVGRDDIFDEDVEPVDVVPGAGVDETVE